MAPKKFETCPVCQKEYEIGEWPFCPLGRPEGMMTFRPYWDEHLLDKPVLITSWGHRRRLMRETHNDYRGKQVGMPGCEV